MDKITRFIMLLVTSFSFLNAEHSIPEGLLMSAGLSTTFVAKFALFLGVLLLWTVVFGHVLKVLFRCPVIAGQIIAGIIVGPSCFNLVGWPVFEQPLQVFDAASNTFYSLASSDLFLFFVVLISSVLTVSYLLWIAGHETDIRDVFHVGITATAAGILGALMPIACTLILAYYMPQDFSLVQSVSLGLVLAATSVSIPVAMLVAQRKMHLKSSKATLGAAIIDDVFSIILLSMFFIALQAGTFGAFTGVMHTAHDVTIGEAIVYMLVSFVTIFLTGYFVIPPVLGWLKSHHASYLIPSFASGIMLFYFSFAELIGGLAGITGAFFAGLFHRMGDSGHQAEKSISPFVSAFLLPLFLGSIGLQVNIALLSLYEWYIALLLLVVAIISKLGACAISTFLSNLLSRTKTDQWSMLETYLFGASMIARGEVGLVISTILRGSQIISAEQYVVAVVVIILSTIVSPLMLAIGFYIQDTDKKQQATDCNEHVCNVGQFNAMGTHSMFAIILGRIDAAGVYKTSVDMHDGSQIVTLEGHHVKIVFNPEEGIIFRGNRQKIEEIIAMVKKALVQELGKLPETDR